MNEDLFDELDDIDFLDDDESSDVPIVERIEEFQPRDESGHQRYSRSDASTRGADISFSSWLD